MNKQRAMQVVRLVLVGAVASLSTLAVASSVHAHASYNIAGYGTGLGGSTNGADGQPELATAGAIWTNGDPLAGTPPLYTGHLPVMWYSGLHSTPTTRVIQTGGGVPAPPNGSLLQQINTYNGGSTELCQGGTNAGAVCHDDSECPGGGYCDLQTDRVLAVGGVSWSDPDNSLQGWGHGLDYGLIHVTPLNTVLQNGPVTLTVSLQDDPTDGVVTRLAMALYGNWDSSATSERHQTFVTQPTPTDNPLGTTNLKLLGYAVGSVTGGPVSLSINVDNTYNGQYTLLVGALGGVAGQYIVTTSITPDTALGQCEQDLANVGSCPGSLSQCQSDLGQCQSDLGTATADADGDGVGDAADLCPGTPASTEVDSDGCSRAQFCAEFDATMKLGQKECKKADWKNDEPLLSGKTQDCTVNKPKGTKPIDWTCVPTDIP